MSEPRTTYSVERVTAEDAGQLLVLQRAAYVTEAQIYNAPSLPALVQTLDELTAEIETVDVFKISVAGRMIGSVRARQNGELLEVGRLVVSPDLQGQGIGTALMDHVHYRVGSGVASFEVFTGHLSTANLRLYGRLGYLEDRRRRLSPAIELVYLRRTARPESPEASDAPHPVTTSCPAATPGPRSRSGTRQPTHPK